VTFRNNFSFQNGFDGGVLEVSLDQGQTFQDVVAAGGTFAAGGYNGTISGCCGNPLAGRQAWTGDSGGFITTTVEMPPTAPVVLLRWRMGSDISGSGQGWRVDSVLISQSPEPTPPRPTPTPRPRPTPLPRPISFHLVYLNVSPRFKPVSSDRRFQNLVQRVGLSR
jgi:hypothetical protein